MAGWGVRGRGGQGGGQGEDSQSSVRPTLAVYSGSKNEPLANDVNHKVAAVGVHRWDVAEVVTGLGTGRWEGGKVGR